MAEGGLLRWWLTGGVALGLWLQAISPGWAYHVWIEESQTAVRPAPDVRSGPVLLRLPRQKVSLLQTRYGSDGQLWCLIRLAPRQQGWVPASALNPALEQNTPLRLQDIPGPLLHVYAQQQWALTPNHTKIPLWLEVAFCQQQWKTLRARLDFLDLARRVGVPIHESERQQLQQELRALEQAYQQVMKRYQLPIMP